MYVWRHTGQVSDCRGGHQDAGQSNPHTAASRADLLDFQELQPEHVRYAQIASTQWHGHRQRACMLHYVGAPDVLVLFIAPKVARVALAASSV